jgi:hypothetical protein
MSRDSPVGIALGYWLDNRCSRVRFPGGTGNFSLHHRVQNGSGAHPASYPMDNRGSFPGVKRPGREADHSPPSSAEVKNAWSYNSAPQYAFMAWCLVKHRDNFTFYLKREELARGWRRLHNEELRNLYDSPDIIRIIQSCSMRWAGYAARTGR